MRKLVATIAVLAVAGCSESFPPPPPAIIFDPSYIVFFDWDRSTLSHQALLTIQQLADQFRKEGTARVTAVGHTDRSGPESYNLALSLRRAAVVKEALVRDGVPERDRDRRQRRDPAAGPDRRRRPRAAEPPRRDHAAVDSLGARVTGRRKLAVPGAGAGVRFRTHTVRSLAARGQMCCARGTRFGMRVSAAIQATQ